MQGRVAVKHRRNKKNQGLVTKIVTYRVSGCSQHRMQEVRIDVRRGEIVDTDYAAAMVALRTGTALRDVRIVEIRNANG